MWGFRWIAKLITNVLGLSESIYTAGVMLAFIF